MRFLQYLNEEYVAMGRYPIFVNPDAKELREACDNGLNKCRFFFDVNNKNFYIWDYNQLHEDTSKILNTKGIHNKYPYNGTNEVWGVAKLQSGKLVLSDAYVMSIRDAIAYKKPEQKRFYKKLEFVNRWLGDTLLDYIRREIKDWEQ